MEFWIDIQASDGSKYGDGPITTATQSESTARLDRAGRFSFEMPAADPRASLVQVKREAWCYGIIDDEVQLIWAGIIDEIETAVDPDGTPILRVSGDDLLRELTYRSVGFLEIVTTEGQASPDALSDIMAEAPGAWSLDTGTGYGATENDVYAKFAGETVLAAFNKVGEHTGEHFRLGSGKQVVWLQDDLVDSGVRAIGQADPSAVQNNDDVCLITELAASQGSYDLCTRLFAFGAGNAQARVSLADTTVSAHTGYVIDKSNPKGANLTNSAAFTTYGQIERFLSWKEISPISNTDADIESAANALYAAAYQYLSRYCQVQASYQLAVTKLDKPVLPGQKIRVIWQEYVDGVATVDIDAELTVLETTTRLDAAGMRTVAMQVSTIDAWPQTFSEVIAGQLEEARLMDGHPQTFAGYYSEGLGNFNISPTYSAIARFKFDDRITRLVSAKLRFKTSAFEATATAAASGGGSSQTSASGGGGSPTSQSGGGSSETSESDAHTHDLQVVNLPSSGAPVYYTPSVLFCNGVSGSIFTQSDSHSHDVSIPSHSHSVNIPSHTHGVTIPNHTHGLTYGIHRSGTYPGGVTIWINGVDKTFELTGEVSLGTSTGSTGIVEVELADILNADFRREHTIEFKCSSGFGVIMNAALRAFVIVQAILVLPAGPVSYPTPGEPTVAVAATADGWRVTWLAVENAESYRLYGNTVGEDAGAEEITLTTSREVLVSYGSGYSYFAATAIAGANESDIGPWATDTTVPDAPTWVSHVYQLQGHFVNWYHSDLETIENFILYRNTSPEDSGATEVETVGGTITSYLYDYTGGNYFGVKAVSYAGIESAITWSSLYDPTPGEPSSPAGTVTPAGFLISWSAPADAAAVREYVVYSDDNAGGTSQTERWRGNALQSAPIGYSGDEYFWVEAIGYDGSTSAQVATGQIDPTPATPANPAVQMVERGGFVMSWDATTGAGRYEVQGAEDGSGTNAASLWTGDALTTPTINEPDITYFRVRAQGYDDSSVNWSAWLTDTNSPPIPAGFSVTGGYEQILLNVDLSTDTSYTSTGFRHWEVQQADDDSGTNSTDLAPMLPSNLPRMVPQFEKSRYYRIRAVDWAGNVSTWTGWQEGINLARTVQDKFDGYGGDQISSLENLYWLRVADFDQDESWALSVNMYGEIAKDTTTRIEGDSSLKVTTENNQFAIYADHTFSPAIDLSQENRFTSDDYLVLQLYMEDYTEVSSIFVYFLDSGDWGRDAFLFYRNQYPYNIPSQNGWVTLKMKRSDASQVNGGVDWSDVTTLRVGVGNSAGVVKSVYLDDLRIVKADPDGTTYNDTSPAWDRAAHTGTDAGEWHIYEGNRAGEPSKPYSYGQIKIAASPSTWYLGHKPLDLIDIYNGTIQTGVYLKDDDGAAGLAFFIADVTADSWDMYVIEADSDGDTITLAKYVGGTRTQIAQASFTFAPDQILWLGADFRDFQADGGRIRVYASLSEGNLIQAANLVLSEQDTSLAAGGSVGVLSKQSNVRFVNFVAGSPAHAEVADVALALDGPILTGETSRLWLRDNAGDLEKSTDGATWEALSTIFAPLADLQHIVDGGIAWNKYPASPDPDDEEWLGDFSDWAWTPSAPNQYDVGGYVPSHLYARVHSADWHYAYKDITECGQTESLWATAVLSQTTFYHGIDQAPWEFRVRLQDVSAANYAWASLSWNVRVANSLAFSLWDNMTTTWTDHTIGSSGIIYPLKMGLRRYSSSGNAYIRGVLSYGMETQNGVQETFPVDLGVADSNFQPDRIYIGFYTGDVNKWTTFLVDSVRFVYI